MRANTTNITLKLPKRTLAQIKQIAARRNMSVSRLINDVLTDLASHDTGYAQAKQRHLTFLATAPDLGTSGRSPAARDELHER